jgi:hypothetical protein
MIQQVYGPKNAFSKLMGLSYTFLQVDGPLVHFTLSKINDTLKIVKTILLPHGVCSI